jgi:hypothetical protein
MSANIRAAVHSGRLTDSELNQIQQHLDGSALRSLALPPMSPQQKTRAGGAASLDVLTVNIHRADGVQRLFFDDANQAAAGSGRTFPSSYGNPAMKPILDLYGRISEGQNDLQTGATPKCSLRVRE